MYVKLCLFITSHYFSYIRALKERFNLSNSLCLLSFRPNYKFVLQEKLLTFGPLSLRIDTLRINPLKTEWQVSIRYRFEILTFLQKKIGFTFEKEENNIWIWKYLTFPWKFLSFSTRTKLLSRVHKREDLFFFVHFFFTFSETISLVILTAALAFFPLIKISLEYIQMWVCYLRHFFRRRL